MVEGKTVKVNPKTYFNMFNPKQERLKLNKNAKRGLILTKIDEEKYTYSKITDQEPYYLIDFFQSADLDINHYIKDKTEQGWRHLGSIQDWHYFIANAENEPERVYSDFRPYIKRISKSIPINLFLAIATFALVMYYEVYRIELNLPNLIIAIILSGGAALAGHRLINNIETIQFLHNIKIEDQTTYME